MGEPQTTEMATTAAYLTQILENHKIDVPLLPETAQRVIQLTQDPESDAAQIAAVIQSDPTLGGHVMRIANSAAYTPNSNLVSIQQAISRLGMVEIGNIALSTSINCKLFNAPTYKKHIQAIWRHALATALWSKEIARVMRSNVEAAFLCGLLHSIGKPVILQTLFDNPAKADHRVSDDNLIELYHQFEPGYAQAVSIGWELPTLVAEAIIFYKNFQQAPSASELAATIAFGNQLAISMLEPDLVDKKSINTSAALTVINLYPDEVETIISKQSVVQTNMAALSQ
ncbi:MAG: HDOD domain-containing protein [Cellvibrionaceae bacterium]|nr:HDOD domain-containing protein [Cellvibrionaceae bacterium]